MNESSLLESRFALGSRLIAEEMKKGDVIGGAFDGSLATGKVWPTSDLDFTIFPKASAPPTDPRSVPAYRFYYPEGPLSRFHLFVELRVVDGVFVNMHIKTEASLDALRRDYPQSLIESAQSIPGDLEATHFLDGLAIMRIIEDPHGTLAAAKAFVARHRFAPEVLVPRLRLMSASAERLLVSARESLARQGTVDVIVTHGLAVCMAHMWLETAHRIYSKKEQDARMAELAEAEKVPRAHALYRAILGVDVPAEQLRALLPAIAEYAARVDMMFKFVEEMAAAHVAHVGADVVERVRAYRLWAALTLASVPVALEKGCHAHVAFAMQGVGPSALNRFVTLVERVAPTQAAALMDVCRAEVARSGAIWSALGLVDEKPDVRARQLDAATELLALTRRHARVD